MTSIHLVIEHAPKKTFASALEWPGWSRPGKDEDAAVAALFAYGERYRPVVDLAGMPFPETHTVEIVDRLAGGGATDFGVPSLVHAVDRAPLAGDELARHIALLDASWAFFFAVVERVTPELRKGPRGGGRDRDEIVAHVIEADRSYARQLDVQTPPFLLDPLDREAFAEHREAVLAAMPAFSDGHTRTEKGWPLRYTIRRMAWHILDHAWEMEDKTLG